MKAGGKGFTLIEMTIVVVVMGVLLSYALPKFHRTLEESRVDHAAAHLESLWTAQRLYWVKHRVFAPALGSLDDAGLLDAGFLRRLSDPRAPFTFRITAADAASFQAEAARAASRRWSGALVIDEQGRVSGHIIGSHGEVIDPRTPS